MGLPQLTTEKMRIGEVGIYAPVGLLYVATATGDAVDLPTYHFGYGMSASFTVCPSRGFKKMLCFRSTVQSFPSPRPPRGWQFWNIVPRASDVGLRHRLPG